MRITPFSFHYYNEVEKSEDSIYRYLKHKEVVYKVNKSFESQSFTDEKGNEWVYTEGTFFRNFNEIKKGYCYKFSDGTSLTRTNTAEEVVKKVMSYFCRFIVNEDEVKPAPFIKMKEKDKSFYLN
jgi:hypothetical protein